MRRRIISIGLLIGAWGPTFLAAPAAAQPAAPPVQRIRQADLAATPGRDLVLSPYVTLVSDQAIVGLPERADAEVLTWDRAYTLAVIRARAGGTAAAESLDPRALAEQARRHGAADFARFRKEFLAGRTDGGGAFRDPGEAYLAILRRLQLIHDTQRHIAALENLSRLVQELIQGESMGLSQLDADLLAEALMRGRERMSAEIAGFRDAFDELRAALGLSPHAAVIPDRRGVAAFRDVFTAVDRWSMQPDRDLAQLPRIVERLPVLGDVVLDGRPVLRTIEEAPARMEELLTDTVRLAIRNRAGTDRAGRPEDGDIALELRVRRRIRRLLELRRGYEDAKRGCALAVRLRDQAFERLLDPSSRESASLRTPAIRGLIGDHGRIRDAQDRLVELWTTFQSERLALYRGLGTLPHDNWEAFYAVLSATRGQPQQAPAGPVPPAPPAPGPS